MTKQNHDIDDIVRTERRVERQNWKLSTGEIRTTYHPGVMLTMKNGEQWFHPYSGGAPKKRRSK